jgi:hypothetical protein
VNAALTRRQFLAVSAAALRQPATAATGPTYVYASESGAMVRDRPIVVGFLITRTPEKHLRAIRALRTRMKYTRELEYSSTDRFKIPFARELMHYFARDPDLRFAARVVYSDRLFKGTRREQLFADQYHPLFSAAVPPGAAVLRHKRRRRKRNGVVWNVDQEYRRRFEPLERLGLIERAQPIAQRVRDGLVELSNVLTGSLYGDSADSRGNRAKTLVTTRLRGLLEIETLTEPAGEKWQPRTIAPKG